MRATRPLAAFIAALVVASLVSLSPQPAAAASVDDFPIYDGEQFKEMVELALETLPYLGATTSPGSITGSSSTDSRIWDRAFERGYRMQRLATTSKLVWRDGFRMQPAMASAWSQLKSAAAADGYSIAIVSAYRTVSEQRSLFLKKLYSTSDAGIDARLAYSAPPGASRHHTGYTLDFKQPGGSHGGFVNTAAYQWISRDNFYNAKRFGFVPSYPPDGPPQGPNPEPWEYVYVGPEIVQHNGPFYDVLPSNTFVGAIEWMRDAGLTNGCDGGGKYFCPDEPVDRGSMAAFFKRAFKLPASAVDHFVDDNASVFEPGINAIADAEIARGCNPPANSKYCPDDLINRATFAALLRRALDLPSPAVDYFVDDDGSIFEDSINALRAAGLTYGCGQTSFCPDRLITRAEFAALLFRSKDALP